MPQLNNEDIYEILDDIVPRARVSGLQIDENGHVIFSILVDPAEGTKLEDMRLAAEAKVKSLPKVQSVTAVLTAEKKSAPDPHGMNKNPKLTLPVKNIIAVASGKGGVGKSTIAVNIAAALARQGQRVGLLDCDIYGPNVPSLVGLPLDKPEQDKQGKLIPFEAHGMKVMSIGFLAPQDAAMIWRGPMVQTAIYQMLRDVVWADENAPLDYLILDMPPGTGDAQLTIAQKIDVTGAIIVSTPQDLSLQDARKAIAMFEKTDVPILGLIENMSIHVCSNCGHEEAIFGHDTVKQEAEKQRIEFLGALPLSKEIHQGGIIELENFESFAAFITSQKPES